MNYGRRGTRCIFGAFKPADGAALTQDYEPLMIANWVDFLEHVEDWIPLEITRVDSILNNLSVHRATDVLKVSLGHPRWEFVFPPQAAAYLNLIGPWWKTLRSLAHMGCRFETLEELAQAVRGATADWN